MSDVCLRNVGVTGLGHFLEGNWRCCPLGAEVGIKDQCFRAYPQNPGD